MKNMRHGELASDVPSSDWRGPGLAQDTVINGPAADLYCELPETDTKPTLRKFVPGIVTALIATLAAAQVSIMYGVPLTLAALLVGLALNFLANDERLDLGLEVCSTGLLRFAIILTGTQISLDQIIALGGNALLAVPAVMAGVFITVLSVGHLLKLDRAIAVLYASAVAICGMSAIAGMSSILPRGRLSSTQLAVALVTVPATSAIAMIAYPAVCTWLGLSHVQAGFVLGASIPDVSQTIGAGYSLSPEAGQMAVLVKMERVALLGPVMLLVALCFSRSQPLAKGWRVPWFIFAFLAMAVVTTLGWLPTLAIEWGGKLALGMLAMAITATAIRSRLNLVKSVGWRPLALVGCGSLAAISGAILASYINIK